MIRLTRMSTGFRLQSGGKPVLMYEDHLRMPDKIVYVAIYGIELVLNYT